MKYKLKKDLPFAKAGAEVVVEELYIPQIKKPCYLVDSYWGNREVIGEVGNELTESFIEEVKPREWGVTVIDGKIYRTGTVASSSTSKVEYIKVREVIG